MSLTLGSSARTTCCIAAIIAIVVSPAPGSAQAILEIDHATGRASLRLSDSDKGVAVRNGAALRLKWPDSIRVRVTNGNTALYRYSLDTREAAQPAEAVTGRVADFLKKFVPYLPEVAIATVGPPNGGRPRGLDAPVYHSRLPAQAPPDASDRLRDALSAGRSAEHALAVLDERIYGQGGLHQSTATVLSTLELMRAGGDVEQLSRALSDSLTLTNKGCGGGGASERLPLTSELLTAVQTLMRSRRNLTIATALAGAELYTLDAQRALRDSLQRIGALADTAAADYEDIISAAYAFERLALPIAHACASWNGRAVGIDSIERRVVVLKAEPRSEPEVARVATRGSSTFSLTLVSTPRVISSLGASLLVAPDATYPTFATRSATGGVQIFQNSTRDARFAWGLTFGLGWHMSSALTARGMRFWAPEITFTPATEIKTLALGTAVSLGMVKLGAGAVWVRHTQLLGQTLGAVIPTKDDLRTGEAYGKGKLYISLSIFDVPPFTSLGK